MTRPKKNLLHDEPCKAYSRLPHADVIFAVVPKMRQVFAFNTGVQSFVEDFMIDIGVHTPDYYLCSRQYKGLLLPMGTSLWENDGNVDPDGYGKGKPWKLRGKAGKSGTR